MSNIGKYLPEPSQDLNLEWIIRELYRIGDAINYVQLYVQDRTVTGSTYTVTDEDGIILADATSNTIAITLPRTVKERLVSVKKLDNINNVTIQTSGSETIDGAATKVLSTQYDSVTLICDGSNWWII